MYGKSFLNPKKPDVSVCNLQEYSAWKVRREGTELMLETTIPEKNVSKKLFENFYETFLDIGYENRRVDEGHLKSMCMTIFEMGQDAKKKGINTSESGSSTAYRMPHNPQAASTDESVMYILDAVPVQEIPAGLFHSTKRVFKGCSVRGNVEEMRNMCRAAYEAGFNSLK